MKGNTKEVAFLKGRRMRVTRLDACGRVVYGDNARATSEGFVSISVTSNTNATDEIRVTGAAGQTLLYEASVTELAGFSPELTFARVDPEMLSLMTGQPVVIDSFGNVVGFDVDTKIQLTGLGFALEVWMGAPAGGDGCTDASATGQYGYVLFPFLQGGVLGDFSIENGGISFVLTGASTKDGNAWGRGPYDVQLNGAAGAKLPGKMISPSASSSPTSRRPTPSSARARCSTRRPRRSPRSPRPRSARRRNTPSSPPRTPRTPWGSSTTSAMARGTTSSVATRSTRTPPSAPTSSRRRRTARSSPPRSSSPDLGRQNGGADPQFW
jgi:hypothetical protein